VPGSQDESRSSEPVEITVLVTESEANTAEFWDASIAAASAKVPGVTVKKIVSIGDEYPGQLRASGQLPDVLGQVNVDDLHDTLMPYDEAWLEENFLFWESGVYSDGNVYTPSTGTQIVPLVFYNKTIFADNGISVPKTWSEFLDVVAKLRAAGVTPIEMAGGEGWAADIGMVGAVTTDVLGKDPEWIQKLKAGEAKFSDADFVGAVQKMIDLVEAGAYDPAALSADYSAANQNFLDGKSGMYPMGSWFIGKGYLTDEQAENIGVFLWPSDNGTAYLPTVAGGTFAVNKESPNAEVAMEWAKAWATNQESYKPLIENDAAFILLKNASLADLGVDVTPLYMEGYELATGDAATSVPSFRWTGGKNAIPSTVADGFMGMAQAVFTNSDAAALCADLDAQWAAAQ
jgi:multiple sugar transport system substrate-binding protein/raffinose/stachyose/melibiose transport system substrate-binding protein